MIFNVVELLQSPGVFPKTWHIRLFLVSCSPVGMACVRMNIDYLPASEIFSFCEYHLTKSQYLLVKIEKLLEEGDMELPNWKSLFICKIFWWPGSREIVLQALTGNISFLPQGCTYKMLQIYDVYVSADHQPS